MSPATDSRALVDQALERLSAAVTELRNGDGWKAWLQMATRMPSYSFNNQLLILAQRPDATMVAGFRQWQATGRTVMKGERALRILAPMIRKVEEIDKETGQPARRVVGFKAVPVFDVAQTDGDPLPEPAPVALLDGQAPPGLWDALAEQVAAAGFALHRASSADQIGGANGLTDYSRHVVIVRQDVSDAQAVKTLAHELAHVQMHGHTADSSRPLCRGEVEVEAESVAFLVTAHAGLPSDDYTFGYVASWSAMAPDDVLVSTAERVRATASRIIDAIDSHATADPVTEPLAAAERSLDPTLHLAPWQSAAPAAVTPVLPAAVQAVSL